MLFLSCLSRIRTLHYTVILNITDVILNITDVIQNITDVILNITYIILNITDVTSTGTHMVRLQSVKSILHVKNEAVP